MPRSRRCGVVVLPMAFRPDTEQLAVVRLPLVQGASRNAVHRLRLNTMQRPGDMPQMALAQKKLKICAKGRGSPKASKADDGGPA